MESRTALEAFIVTDESQSYLKKLDIHLPRKIDFISPIEDIVLEFEWRDLQWANVNLDEIRKTMIEKEDETIRFIAECDRAFIEPDGGKGGVVNYPPHPTFLIGHIINYILIERGSPSELKEYVRKRKIPGMTAYIKRLNDIYRASQSG